MAMFFLAVPICSCIGSPISSHILLMNDVLGLKGWQWLFVIEGTPAVILGVLSWFVLEDSPSSAEWLSTIEKDQLAQELHGDEETLRSGLASVWVHVARSSIAYFMFSVGLYGLSFWLPRILVATGASTTATGWWAALPYGVGAVAMVLVAQLRGGWWLNAMYMLTATGFIGVALSHSLPLVLVSFAAASAGLFGGMPLFWSATTSRMSGTAAGAGIAIVNSIGAIGGFTGPAVMGWLHDATHSYAAGLWSIAACLVLGAFVVSGPKPTFQPTAAHKAS
jgi:cyanate permease